MSASSIDRLKGAFDAAHIEFRDALSCHDYAGVGKALTRELNVLAEFARELAALRLRLLQQSTAEKVSRDCQRCVARYTRHPLLSSTAQ
jgi:hypothetical protein